MRFGRVLIAAAMLASCSSKAHRDPDTLRELSVDERQAAEAQKAGAERSIKELREEVLEQRVARLEQDMAAVLARLDHPTDVAPTADVPVPLPDLPATLPAAAPPIAEPGPAPAPAPRAAAPASRRPSAPKPAPVRQPRLTYDIGK